MQYGAIRQLGSGCCVTHTGVHQVEDGEEHCRLCGDDVPEAVERRRLLARLAGVLLLKPMAVKAVDLFRFGGRLFVVADARENDFDLLSLRGRRILVGGKLYDVEAIDFPGMRVDDAGHRVGLCVKEAP